VLWIYTLSNIDLTLFSVNGVCHEEVGSTMLLCQLWCVPVFLTCVIMHMKYAWTNNAGLEAFFIINVTKKVQDGNTKI